MTPERKKYLAGIGRKETVIRTYIDNVKQQLKDCKKWLKADNGSYAPRLEMIKYNILITKQILMMLKKQLPQRWPEKKLKPCPFCGCKEIYTAHSFVYHKHCGEYITYCPKCQCRTNSYISCKPSVEAWNRRV